MGKEKDTFRGLREKLPTLVFLFCLIQPLLDVAGFWQIRLGVGNAVTMLLRMVLLGGSVLLGFLLSDRKKYYLATVLILAGLTASHILACSKVANGYAEPVTDLINLVRIYFLPMMTLCFITFLRQNVKVFPAMIKGMVADILMIAAVQLLSTLTGTDPHTYAVDQTGTLGWFLWTNSQSAILAMLTPIAICWSIRHWQGKLLPIVLITAISEATLYVLAPRLAFASFVAAGLGVALCQLLADRRSWRQALAVALVTCLFLGLYPISATHNRLNKNEVRAEKTEKYIQELDIQIATETVPATGEKGGEKKPAKPIIVLDENNANKLERLYKSQDIIWSMVDRFGRNAVFEIYNYTLDPTILGNTRTMKINFCKLLMEESGTLSKLFGLNLKEMTHQRYDAKGELVTDNYDVENDLHGMYFLTGIVGLVLMAVFLLYFGVRALLAVLRKPKEYFTLPLASFAIAYGLALIHAYFTASVLRRNNASFYLAIVLAGLWYLSRRHEGEKQ